MIENTPIDYLDFASPESGLGSKMGIDATTKVLPETHREWGQKIKMNGPEVQRARAASEREARRKILGLYLVRGTTQPQGFAAIS